ncbi:MAG: hypothetical protein HRF50_02700 [Phycisphaerae bacterium]
MISTDNTTRAIWRGAAVRLRSRAPLSMLLIGLALPIGRAQETAPAGAEGLEVRVVALGEESALRFGDREAAQVGDSDSFYSDAPLLAGVSRPGGGGAAILYVADAGLTIVIGGSTVVLRQNEEGGVDVLIQMPGELPGYVDLYHQSDAPAVRALPMAGNLEEALAADDFAERLDQLTRVMIGLKRGALRVLRTSAAGDSSVAVAAGSAAVSGEANGGIVLDAAGKNRVLLTAAGAIGQPDRLEGVPAQMQTDRSRIVQLSLLPEFVRVAEGVAEGDIEPPTRGSTVVAAAVTPPLRLREIVPRGGIVSRQSVSTVGGAVARAVQSTAERFIGERTGGAALAVVGGRVERTRITGTSGAGVQRPPLSISRDLSRRFFLGRGAF